MSEDATADMIRRVLDHTANQVEPDFSRLREALGMPELDAGAFAVGMLAAGFAMQGVDLILSVKSPYGHLIRAFVHDCRDVAS